MRSGADRARRAVADGVYELKTLVARSPAVAIPIERRRGRGVVVSDATQIVIEAYPRSASTFVVAAFRLAQEPSWVEIAHHTHMPAQVIEAVRRGIPALVLVRPPRDAVVSLLIHSPERTAAGALRGYTRFYEPLLPMREGFVTATFDDAIGDLGGVIDRINDRFGTTFVPFVHAPEHLARIRDEIDADPAIQGDDPDRRERRIARPSDVRRDLRADVAHRYDAAPGHLRSRAEAVYASLSPSP